MILVFGANGQLGRELTAVAARRAVPMIGLSREVADITNERAVTAAIATACPTLLVNAAAYTDVDRAETDQAAAWRANAVGPAMLAEVAAAAGLPLVHISTDYVFDGMKTGAYCEDDSTTPLGVYGESKSAGELAIRRRATGHVILRTAWLYSRHGRNFVRTILRLAVERDELRVVADQFGSPTAAADVAEAIVAIAPRLLESGAPFGTYHLAGGGRTSWHGLAERVVEAQANVTGRRPRVTPITTAEYPTAAKRPLNSQLDCARFARVFGIPSTPWQESLDRVVTEVLTTEGRA